MAAALAPHRVIRAPAARRPSRIEWIARAVLQAVLLVPVVRWFARPLVVRGAIPGGPVVFAPNHASHADVCALLAALPRRIRARTQPAAAADYFFAGRARGWATRLLFHAFPFPRRGGAGPARAHAALAAGRNVVLFPEGTRSTDGRIAQFRPGIGVLAARGATIVPVGIAGTRDVISKGARFPRRASVVVTFGAPIRLVGADVPSATARVERSVRALAARAALQRPPTTPTWYARVRAFARTPRALGLLFCWGFAEALVLPIVPDVGIVVLTLAAPARLPLFIASAIAGSVAGGAVAYGLGAMLGPAGVASLPLVTDRMAEAASGWLSAEGAAGLAHQPWAGVPYKAFAPQAAAAGVGLGGFLWHTLVERGARFLVVGAAVALPAALGRRFIDRVYTISVLAGLTAFVIGLTRVVAAWS